MDLTLRRQHIISGLIALVLVAAAVFVSVSWSFGAFDNTYPIKASFDAAGQGLQKNSDVKVRGINIGKVDSVKLVDGQALVTMSIKNSDRIPYSAVATVRAKTLFGEKFVDVDPGAGETSGPFYGHDGELLDKCDKSKQPANSCTVGGFELEQVLADAYPLLKKINPGELMTVISTLADAGRDLGPNINRSIVNGEKVLDVNAAHDADTRQFLTDLATLSQQLGVRSDDIVAAANDLNVALPPLNARGKELNTLLVQTSRLSNDVADLLQSNKDFIDKSFNGGQAVLDIIYNHRNDLIPTVVGLRQYIQTLSQVIRVPAGDGTYMAAVEGLLGGQACGVIATCPGAAAAPPPPPDPALALPAPALPGPLDALVGGVTGAVPSAPQPATSNESGVGQLVQYLAKVGSQ
jgi:phospholipid/cholesterol/gamma-HCH transport system substrate-binding protein